MKKDMKMRVFNLSMVLLTFFIIYLPIFVVMLLSFHGTRLSFESYDFTLKWYRGILDSPYLMRAIGVTLQVAVLSTLLSTILGTLFAIGIHSMKKKTRLRMMILNNIPVVNPDIITGIMLYIVFFFLRSALGVPMFGFQTMLIAHVFFSIPFVVLSVLPKLKSLDANIFDAALDLGATKFKAVLLVIIPSIKVGILAGALIAFTMSIDDFIISYFVSGTTQNVSIYAYSMLARRDFPMEVFAYNTLIVVITIGIMITFSYSNRKDKKVKGEKK